MKVSKYLAIAVGVIVILLVVGWLLRNSLIERLSSPLLEEYGLKITDVSLDALATRNASVGYLELEHVNGTTIAIDSLTLPIRRSTTGVRSLRAAKVSIELPAGSDDELLDLAGVLIQLLELPLQLPQTEIIIGELSAASYPAVRDLRWQFMDAGQRLTASLDPISLEADISQVSDAYYVAKLSFSDARTATGAQSVTADLQRTGAGVAIEGSGTFDLSLWSPVIALLGFDAVRIESGIATMRFDGEINFDSNQIPFVNVDVTATTPVALDLAGLTHLIRSVRVNAASTTELSMTLTDLQWTLRQPQASVSVIDGYGNDIGVSLTGVSCRSGPSCSGMVGIVADVIDLPFADVARLEFEAAQELEVADNAVQMHLRQGATIALTDIVGPDLELTSFDATLSSPAEFERGDSGWRFTSQSIDFVIEEYAVVEGVTFSVTAFLDDVSAGDDNQRQFVRAGVFASSSHASWLARRISLPGFSGSLSRHGNELTVDLETKGLRLEAGIYAKHDLARDTGGMSVKHAGLSFASQPLSRRIAPRPKGWDVIAGDVDADLTATWQKDGTGWKIGAETAIRAADLAGNWQDTAFAGLTTALDATFDSATGFAVQPSAVRLALLDVGVPVENLSADYTLDPGEQSVDVANLRMSAFGGVITADPFSFSTARERNNMTLHAASIDLAEILSIEEFEAIEISGRIGAELPVTIDGKTVTVSGGKLTGDTPGGFIRYRPGMSAGQADASSIGFATRALSNFQYDSLTSDVDYDSDGDLRLQMRLTGRNPDLESNRPVILNLGVENNVPQMLRSLQAARAVEDVLERRLKQ